MPISDAVNHIDLGNYMNAKQLFLLAAAEESYSMAATVLKPALEDVLYRAKHGLPEVEDERLRTGLHLLEEGMKSHNRYMQSLK